MWTLLVISVFVVAIGVKIISTSISKKKRCTVEVLAKIVNVETLKSHDIEDVDVRVPSYSYWYNGTEYISKTGNFMAITPHEEGETVRIRVNPDDPKEIYDPSMKDTSKISGSFTIIIGVVFFISVLVKILNSISITIK